MVADGVVEEGDEADGAGPTLLASAGMTLWTPLRWAGADEVTPCQPPVDTPDTCERCLCCRFCLT